MKPRVLIDYLTLVFDHDELQRLKAQTKASFASQPLKTNYREIYKQILNQEEDNLRQKLIREAEAQHRDLPLHQHVDIISALDNDLETMLVRFIEKLNGEFISERELKEDLDCVEKWTIKHNYFGKFRYKHSAEIYCDDIKAGTMAWGSENYGAMLSFTGVGCRGLDLQRVQKLCEEFACIRISRVDLAYDDYAGKHSVHVARKMFKQGLFSLTNHEPSYRYIESGHLTKQGRLKASEGCSFYVGKRQNGKMCRIYEKGKQIKSEQFPDWTRWEVELRNIDRVIPLDVLTEPRKYMAAAYPCLNHLSEVQEVIQVAKRKIEASWSHLKKYHKQSYGKLVNFARHVMQMTDKQIVDQLTEGLDLLDFPNRIKNDTLAVFST